jgi:cellulase (glycosyl hydrolase family 5)
MRILNLLVLSLALPAIAAPVETFRLHPKNPRYFEWQGRPTVLITATEHYGAVLNLDFDYITYLNELQRYGFNLTRTFSGAYREIPGSFNIKENTLAPQPGRFVCPWASDGGNKFDLTKWDAAYFTRLKDFIAEAGKRGIIVELVFFCTMYSDELWQASPMHARNNVNGIGRVGADEVYAMKEKALQDAQEAMVQKVATELNDAPNLYYEICNEPYERGGLTKEWTHAIANRIVATESKLPRRHLIAEGIDRKFKVVSPHPGVSIFNIHGATPECVHLNDIPKVFADDETGGKGIKDFPYRSEGWEFMLAGGAVFDHLDFSFTVAQPGGTHKLIDEPGGGSPALRSQLKVLKDFFGSIDFLKMKSDTNVVLAVGGASSSIKIQALAELGVAYAIYFNGRGPCEATMELPAATYRAEWVNPLTGAVDGETLDHSGGQKKLRSPSFVEDIALRIKRSR